MATIGSTYTSTRDDIATVRVEIDGRWLAKDMHIFFGICDRIYTMYAAIQQVTDLRMSDDVDLEQAITVMDLKFTVNQDGLRVKQVNYGSPGSINFSGLGAAIRELRQVLFFPVDLVNRWRLGNQTLIEASIKNQYRQHSLDSAKRLERFVTLDKCFEMARKYGIPEDQLLPLFRSLEDDVNQLEIFVLQGLVKGVDEVTED